MNHEQFSVKLAAYYKEPMRQVVSVDEEGHERSLPNMRVKENHSWLLRNVREDALEEFFNRVISNFIPTSSVPYPLVSNLEEITRGGYVPDKIEKDGLTMEVAALEFAKVNDIPKDAAPPADATVKQIYSEVKEHNLDNNYIIKKYGVIGALKAWSLYRQINEGLKLQGEMLFRNWKHYMDAK